jgi:hypothetical protein
MNPQRIFMVLDRLAHHSTTGSDLITTVDAMRRLLTDNDGVVAVPSEVLPDVLRGAPAPTTRGRKPTDKALQAEIADLREKLRRAESQKGDQTCRIAALVEQIAKLQLQLDQSKPEREPHSGDFHTYDEVLQAMLTRFGKHHGVPAALFERNARLIEQGETADRITSSAFQQWRKENRFPRYVIAQIETMTPTDLLSRGKWNDDERQFLVEQYSVDPSLSNAALAIACSTKFGRLVTECAIKGELNRLRKAGKVSQYRTTN